jgi:hypothetical protein
MDRQSMKDQGTVDETQHAKCIYGIFLDPTPTVTSTPHNSDLLDIPRSFSLGVKPK